MNTVNKDIRKTVSRTHREQFRQPEKSILAMQMHAVVWVATIVFGLLFLPMNVSASKQKEVVELIKGVDAEYDSGMVDVFINDQENKEEAGVQVGENLTYTISSKEKRYLLLILIHPEGEVNVLFPDYAVRNEPAAYNDFVYPPPNTGAFSQSEPAGIETVVVLAAEKPVTMRDLGFPENSDVHEIKSNKSSINAFVGMVNRLYLGSKVDATVYRYFVDQNVQFGTRAVRRELKRRVEQVDILAAQKNSSDKSNNESISNAAPPLQSDALAVDGIRFESNSDRLTTIGRAQLDVFGPEMQKLFTEKATINVTLEGHTDSAGTRSYNQSLSERRSAAAKRYLVENYGLPGDRILTQGMGEDYPVAANSNAQSRAKNRRVDIRLGY